MLEERLPKEEIEILQSVYQKADQNLVNQYISKFGYTEEETQYRIYASILSALNLPSLANGILFCGEQNLIRETNQTMIDEIKDFDLEEYDYGNN